MTNRQNQINPNINDKQHQRVRIIRKQSWKVMQ